MMQEKSLISGLVQYLALIPYSKNQRSENPRAGYVMEYMISITQNNFIMRQYNITLRVIALLKRSKDQNPKSVKNPNM